MARLRIPKQCERCGVDYPAHSRTQRYCSTTCRGAVRKKEANNLYTGGKISVACTVCGKPFEKWTSDYKKVCSPECRKQLRMRPKTTPTKKMQVTCAFCGVKFVGAPSSKRRFCSRPCYWKHLHTITGPQHPAYRARAARPDLSTAEWRHRLRVRLMQAANYRCAICGGQTQRMILHHLKDPRDAPELTFDESNLQVVCTQCHNDIHHPVVQRWSKRKPD